ncbi:hypothetical protein AB0N89_34550 [Amycolatopsis sp. NPDC089917]|uniref:hypothetical protein n=1 Tax=Amycolatopsis sp. NPDC089917 TaxID=3155187 RepID=UPI0034335903
MVTSGAPFEPGLLRPDLPIPLPPPSWGSVAVSRGLTMLREPAFARAHRVTLWLVTAAVALVALGQFVVVGAFRESFTVGGVVLAVYTAFRAMVLVAGERRQYAFEPVWLAERSELLREGVFEVMRLTVDGRIRDLTNPGDVRELLRRSDDDARVRLDFVYPVAGWERVYRRLGDLEFRPALRPGASAQVRFPQARYGLQPSGRRTYWLLGTPVVISVAAQAGHGAARAGTGSTDRPGAAHPDGGRRPGRS